MEENTNTPLPTEPIPTISDKPTPDTGSLVPGGLENIGSFLPIILIALTIIGGMFGFNFFKNTKKMSEQQATDAKAHNKDIKEVQKELVQLDKQSTAVIEDVKKDDVKAQEQSVKIQEDIDTAATVIQQHEVADESIQDTKNRLKDALDRLGNH